MALEQTLDFLRRLKSYCVDQNLLQGMKMSKSIGNVQDPLGIIEGGQDQKKQPGFGADVLRLWVASVDFQGDVAIGPNIVTQVRALLTPGGVSGGFPPFKLHNDCHVFPSSMSLTFSTES